VSSTSQSCDNVQVEKLVKGRWKGNKDFTYSQHQFREQEERLLDLYFVFQASQLDSLH